LRAQRAARVFIGAKASERGVDPTGSSERGGSGIGERATGTATVANVALFSFAIRVLFMFAKRAASWRCARHPRIMEVEPESTETRAAIGALLEEEA
jgi:hypothetical protein